MTVFPYLEAILATLIILHQPGGEVYVNGDEIMVIRRGPSIGAPWSKSAVLVHDTWIYVLETPAEIKEKLK